MSLVLNMIGGGGSFTATDAILRVQAPATAIVTISKGGTVKTDYGHENIADPTVYDYYFIIHQSQFDSLTPWSVTATVQGITNTKTIIINASDEYDLVFRCRVPDGYQEVEWIGVGSTAGPIIDTGIVASNDWFTGQITVQVDYMHTANGYSYDCFGGFDGTSTNTYNRFYVLFKDNNTSEKIGVSKNDQIWQTGTIANNIKYATIFESNNLTVNVNYINYSTGTSGTLVTKTVSTQPVDGTKWCLFGSYNHSTDVRYAAAKNFRIYKCDIIKNGDYILELVPCYRISDSIAGMYDRITHTFKESVSSTKTFLVGGDIS